MVGEPLETLEDLPRDDFFAGSRDQPVVEKDRRPSVAQTAHADLCLPKASLEFLPVGLIRLLNVCALLKQSLEDQVLYQVGCCELGPSGVQRFEDFLSILIDGQVDDDDLEEFPHD